MNVTDCDQLALDVNICFSHYMTDHTENIRYIHSVNILKELPWHDKSKKISNYENTEELIKLQTISEKHN